MGITSRSRRFTRDGSTEPSLRPRPLRSRTSTTNYASSRSARRGGQAARLPRFRRKPHPLPPFLFPKCSLSDPSSPINADGVLQPSEKQKIRESGRGHYFFKFL